jgi:hypothetical protein
LVGEVAQRVNVAVVEQAWPVIGDAQRPHTAAIVHGEPSGPR